MTDPVSFSIVIPTRNRVEHLAACLRALGKLDFPRSDFEIIVVDDASRVRTADALAGQPGEVSIVLVRLDRNEGPSGARNRGAAEARGEYLVFLDDDCAPAVDWLTRIQECARRFPDSAIGGAILNGRPDHLCSAAGQAILDAVYKHYSRDPENAAFFVSANLTVPARLFRELGGFDQAFRTSEDRDFCARWLRSGRRLVYAPEAAAVHYAADSLTGFWRRHYHYGRGAYRFRRAQSFEASTPIRLERAGFYWRLLGAPFSRGFTFRAAVVAMLVLYSQVASACGFLTELLRHKREPAQPSAGRTG